MSLDSRAILVLDASVAINLLGTGSAAQFIEMLGQPVVMAARAFREIKRHPLKGRDHNGELKEIVDSGHLKICELDKASKELYFELVGADIHGGLDDGEAATIALAIAMSDVAIPALDDKKARNLLASRWPSRRSVYTIELLAACANRGMAQLALADAVYSALRYARMRVPPDLNAWVVSLIGENRAADCPSLRAVKSLRASIG